MIYRFLTLKSKELNPNRIHIYNEILIMWDFFGLKPNILAVKYNRRHPSIHTSSTFFHIKTYGKQLQDVQEQAAKEKKERKGKKKRRLGLYESWEKKKSAFSRSEWRIKIKQKTVSTTTTTTTTTKIRTYCASGETGHYSNWLSRAKHCGDMRYNKATELEQVT